MRRRLRVVPMPVARQQTSGLVSPRSLQWRGARPQNRLITAPMPALRHRMTKATTPASRASKTKLKNGLSSLRLSPRHKKSWRLLRHAQHQCRKQRLRHVLRRRLRHSLRRRPRHQLLVPQPFRRRHRHRCHLPPGTRPRHRERLRRSSPLLQVRRRSVLRHLRRRHSSDQKGARPMSPLQAPALAAAPVPA